MLMLKTFYTLNKLIRYFHFTTNSGFLHEAADYIKFAEMLDTLTEILIQEGIDKSELLNLEDKLPKNVTGLGSLKENLVAALEFLNETGQSRAASKVLDDMAEFLSILLYKLENLS